jgi:hypothetical protein
MLARLQTLQLGYRNVSTISDNGKFCAAAKARAVDGLGPFLGPWID